ncbi:hypothetical protein FGE12_10485 [Aggregicoccus sp. 17bor-14]|uniref:hypothetical protein n=1 Tax=Myxococcaceae TaxID=31 RepID=UPI00129C6D49|nr:MULTISPECIES: hypothetical protein [Myxococcaceae]MBF5042820.1 hypothetical protein [Simulacricoccus sp. 17bor-14]MRI88588.1 hypothetical protein [Aggregicoccus sp. 17bor-14]
MARVTKAAGSKVSRKGRRVLPTLRRTAQRVQAAASLAQLSLGEIIAAAFDTAGGEPHEVLKLVTSPQMTRALGRRIVLTR